MKINALAGVILGLVSGTVAAAQQAGGPPPESTYECQGFTITIHRCGNVGGQDVCMFRADLPNGQNVEGNKPRQEAIALLKACKLQPPGAKKTGGPLNPPYLSEMPSVEKVMQAMKTNDPRETALRQMGAFYQLTEIIATLSGPREIRGYLPDEERIVQEYRVAAYNVGQGRGRGVPWSVSQRKDVQREQAVSLQPKRSAIWIPGHCGVADFSVAGNADAIRKNYWTGQRQVRGQSCGTKARLGRCAGGKLGAGQLTRRWRFIQWNEK